MSDEIRRDVAVGETLPHTLTALTAESGGDCVLVFQDDTVRHLKNVRRGATIRGPVRQVFRATRGTRFSGLFAPRTSDVSGDSESASIPEGGLSWDTLDPLWGSSSPVWF